MPFESQNTAVSVSEIIWLILKLHIETQTSYSEIQTAYSETQTIYF